MSLLELKTVGELETFARSPNKERDVQILCINNIEELRRYPSGLFGHLQNLEEFVSFDNSVEELPDDIQLMHKLKKLNVHDNLLKNIPSNIGNLKHLEKLLLFNNNDEGNEISEIPPTIGGCEALSIINISGNLLTALPDELFIECRQLSLLNVADNKITHLPASISHSTNLTKLNLSGNKLQSLPAELCNLPKLKTLIFSYNQIEELSEEFGKEGALPILEELHALRGGLKSIKGLPRSLKRATLSGNSIGEIPVCLQHVTQLEYLDFSYTEIDSFNEMELENLPQSLQVLHLAWNYIETLPSRLFQHLTNIKELSLEENDCIADLISPEVAASPKLTVEELKKRFSD